MSTSRRLAKILVEPDIEYLRHLAGQEEKLEAFPSRVFCHQRIDYARRRSPQLSDSELRARVLEDHQHYELLGENMVWGGHPDTWPGTSDLEELPRIGGPGGTVLGFRWKDAELEEPELLGRWTQLDAQLGGLSQDILASVIRQWVTRDPSGEVEWPDVPTFYFGNNGEKVDEEKLVRLVEESTGLIMRSIDSAIYLLGDDTFG